MSLKEALKAIFAKIVPGDQDWLGGVQHETAFVSLGWIFDGDVAPNSLRDTVYYCYESTRLSQLAKRSTKQNWVELSFIGILIILRRLERPRISFAFLLQTSSYIVRRKNGSTTLLRTAGRKLVRLAQHTKRITQTKRLMPSVERKKAEMIMMMTYYAVCPWYAYLKRKYNSVGPQWIILSLSDHDCFYVLFAFYSTTWSKKC